MLPVRPLRIRAGGYWPDAAQDLESVKIGQPKVKNDKAGASAGDEFDSNVSGHRGMDQVPILREHARQ